MSDSPPPPPPSGGDNPPPPPPPPPAPPGGGGGGYVPPPPGGYYQPPGGGYGAPPPGGYVPPPPGGFAPAPGYPGYGYAAQRTDGLAIAALVIGILSLPCSIVCLGLILGPTAAIMGFIARQRIATSGGMVGGGGLALAGIILGIFGFLISVGWFFFAIATSVFNQASATPSP